ncbi:MAG: ABC transporter permease [Porticoccaceae bacterium]|nr:MAG: ABC transporter permease [Porticoccaceae bacterium]
MRRLAPQRFFFLLAAALPAAVLLSALVGSAAIPPAELFAALRGGAGLAAAIFWEIRLPRICLGLAVGALLAVSGAVLQGLFRNPLAEPSTIGVTAGASVGAGLAIALGGPALAHALWGLPWVAAGAFFGGLAATLLVYRLATAEYGTSVAAMLLAGIAVTSLAGAFNGLLSYLVDDAALRRISLWQLGSLGGADWGRVALAAAALAPFACWWPRHGRSLNALLLGESEARHLGVAVEWVKASAVLLAALGAGVAVAAAGTLAFVGLVVPHLVRLLIGPDHRFLLPGAALGGALLLVLADAVARVVLAPVELPVGVVTALLGAPFFLVLLRRQRRSLP